MAGSQLAPPDTRNHHTRIESALKLTDIYACEEKTDLLGIRE